MAIFRINESLAQSSNLKLTKDYVSEGISKINESTGSRILGEIEGVFFVPDGISANKRYYSKKFWEYVLASDDVKSKLARKIMYGRIGHEDRDITEDDVNSGKMSHIITELFINSKGEGIGKAIIIDTPAGQNLHACLAAGSDLRISSRASGDYKPNEYYKDDIPVMDEQSYVLDTFDIVIYPGFIETSPKLVTDNYHETKQKTEQTDKKQECVANVEKRRQTMLTKQEKLVKALKEARAAQAKAEARLELSKQRYESLKAKAVKMHKQLEGYRTQGTVDAIKAERAELKEFKAIVASPAVLKESNAKISKVLTNAKNFKKEAEEGKQFKVSLEKLKPVTEQYVKLGSIAELKAIKAQHESVRKEKAGKIVAEKVQHYSKRTGLTREAIRNIFENAKNYKAALATLEALPVKKVETAPKKDESGRIPHKSGAKTTKTEGKEQTSQGSVARRIVEARSAQFKRMNNETPEEVDIN